MRILLNGFIVFLVWTIPCRYWYVCKIKQHCQTASSLADTLTTSEIRQWDLYVAKGGDSLFNGHEQLFFPVPGQGPSLSPDNELFLTKLAVFIKDSPGAILKLTGVWSTSMVPVSNGMYENPGLAQAALIRDILVGMGAGEHQIILDHHEDSLMATHYPIRFTLLDDRDLTDTANMAGRAYSFTNMNFSGANFERGSSNFNPNTDFLSYADSLVTITKINPDCMILITGHTDNEGEHAFNLSLGMLRAEAVKRWLITKGINVSIRTDSKGSEEPLADNFTAEGRQLNRRVNITIHSPKAGQ